MATHDIPILGFATLPDTVGNMFFQELEIAVATAAANLHMLGFTMVDPGGTDQGLYGKFNIPQNYSGTPKIVIRGILDGTISAGLTLGFGFQQTGGIADNETADVAFQAADTASADPQSSSHADEDMYEETIDLTPTLAYAAGDEVFFFFYRDQTLDDATFDFHLTGLFFRYNDS